MISDNDFAGTSSNAADNIPDSGFIMTGAVWVVQEDVLFELRLRRGVTINVAAFRKVTFSNTICRQLTKPAENVGIGTTVKLVGTDLVAMGNQIEADDATIPFIKVGSTKAVLMGNATSGALNIANADQVVPIPNDTFNVIT